MSSRGRDLVSAYWGSYVAILTDTSERSTWILRAPMGSLPCLMIETQGVKLFFSHTVDIAVLRLLTFSINWGYVARRWYKLNQAEETGLNEISSIPGGQCLTICRNKLSRQKYWDPLTVARSEVIKDIGEAASEVGRVTKACVHAHASAYESILLLLSGGLDSSIVAGCLSDGRWQRKLTGVNCYSLNPDCDEREFARAVALRARCELIEVPREADFQIQAALDAAPSEKPQAYIMQVGQTNSIVALARNLGHEAIFSGNGGDEVYGTDVLLSLADYVHESGMDARVLTQARNVAVLNGLLIWKVLLESLAKGWGRHQWNPAQRFRQLDSLVNWRTADKALTDTRISQFWFDRNRYVPPGKQLQMAFIVRHSNEATIPAFEMIGDPDRVDPLLSQPLVETCLRIPTYLAMADGLNRGLARRAFSGTLPPEILRRHWKGMQTGYSVEIFKRNLPFMRDVLLNGRLVQLNLLHRNRLETALSDVPSKAIPGMVKIFSHFSLETWLNIWAKHGARIDPDRETVSQLAAGAGDYVEA